jgi:cytochrome c5
MIQETKMFKYSLIPIFISVLISTAFAEEVSPKDILENRCTVCHNLDVVQKARKNKAEWKSTINRMVNHGAQLNDEEKEVLIEYLSEK